VVFNNDIEVLYKGEKVDLGQFKGGFLKRKDDLISGLQEAVDSGKLDAEYADKQIAFIEDKNVSSVLKFILLQRNNFN